MTASRPGGRPRKEMVVIPLSRLPVERLDWLWPDRIALGTLALLDGDPGEGKSLLTLDLAARLSTGRPLPDGAPGPAACSTVLLSGEDHPARTIVPRLQAAGADLERIRILRVRGPDGADQAPTLPDDCDLLHDAVAESAARLVVVDPFLAFLSAGVCSLNDQLVRRTLDPLARLAAATGAAILLVRHLTKTRRGRRALLHGAGATAIVGAARIAFMASRAADDPGLHLLACTKNNLAPAPPTLAYRLIGDEAGMASVAWEGPVAQTADDLVAPNAAGREEPIHEAMTLLDDLLAHGPVARETILRHTHAAGIADRTLQRAKAALGIQSEARWDPAQQHNVWHWSLPPNTAADQLMQELWQQEAQLRNNQEPGNREPGE